MKNAIQEAIHLAQTTKMSLRMIERVTGVKYATLRRYVKKLKRLGYDSYHVDKMNDAELRNVLVGTRAQSSSKRRPNYAHDVEQLQMRHVTRALLWEEYCLENPKTALSYSQYTDGMRKYMKTLDRTMRQLHKPAETAQVDFAGRTVPYYDAKSGEVYQAQIFIMVLPFSNYTYVRAVESQKLPDWIEAHVKAFSYLNGVPYAIEPDNLKSAVTTPGTQAVINPTYREMAQHYDTVILPTRVRKPQDKAKVENAVLIVSRWILARLRHQKFFSVAEINVAIEKLLVQYNERQFKKLPGSRRSRFEEYEKHLLKPLPVKSYEFAEWIGKQKVGPDYHVYVKGHYYSVPNELVGSKVGARVSKRCVEIYHLGKRITSHERNDEVGSHTTKPRHQTVAHRAYASQTPENLLAWAKTVGKHTTKVVEFHLDDKPHPSLAVRACIGLKRLAEDYGHERLEGACKYAAMIGSMTMTSIRSILRRNIYINAIDKPVQNHMPFHQNLRGASYYVSKEVR